jgi:hypothetical protein
MVLAKNARSTSVQICEKVWIYVVEK